MFTKNKGGPESLYWDGEYRTYRELCETETHFVGVLDDSTGVEVLKVWNEEESSWVDCKPGDYVVKFKNYYSVWKRDFLLERTSHG